MAVVLILVLVEHTLRGHLLLCKFSSYCLNPCFSGTYSQRIDIEFFVQKLHVLILVLVEHTLRGATIDSTALETAVLILVLVEHTLREFNLVKTRNMKQS